jgi:hypothetical protein
MARFALVDDPVSFGHSSVRNTLFHEVGHAFGLGHNFKGSTSYDLATAATYSTSIMDYNLYDLDRASLRRRRRRMALLEYDRQVISALYNGGKDFDKDGDPVSMCKDDDVPSDKSSGSIDPFCLQYDAGNDPSAFLSKNIDLLSVESSSLGSITRACRRRFVTSDGAPRRDDDRHER